MWVQVLIAAWSSQVTAHWIFVLLPTGLSSFATLQYLAALCIVIKVTSGRILLDLWTLGVVFVVVLSAHLRIVFFGCFKITDYFTGVHFEMLNNFPYEIFCYSRGWIMNSSDCWWWSLLTVCLVLFHFSQSQTMMEQHKNVLGSVIPWTKRTAKRQRVPWIS